MAFETMREAVQAIGARAGIDGLSANAKGAFELIIGGVLPVYFQEVGPQELEVQVRVPDLETELTSDMMTALLSANATARAGRFSIEPSSNRVVFGGRLNISAHDGDGLMRAIDAIIREAASVNGSGLDQLRDDARGPSGSDVMSETLLRV